MCIPVSRLHTARWALSPLCCKRSAPHVALFLLPVVSHQNQSWCVTVSSGGVGHSAVSIRWRCRRLIGSLRRPVDGVVRWVDWGRGRSGQVALLILGDGAERLCCPGKCLYSGAWLRVGAAEERPETPVELQTQRQLQSLSINHSCCNGAMRKHVVLTIIVNCQVSFCAFLPLNTTTLNCLQVLLVCWAFCLGKSLLSLFRRSFWVIIKLQYKVASSPVINKH